MSADERILRLENAMATLAELSANHEQRVTRLEEISGRIEEGFRALAQVSVDQQRRVARLEESYVALVEMLGRHDDRLDAAGAREDELRAAQAVSERKIGALADSVARLAAAQARLTDAQAGLADSQGRLTDSQERLTDSQGRLVDSHKLLADAQARLAESQAHSDRRLDALIDIVQNWRRDQEPGT